MMHSESAGKKRVIALGFFDGIHIGHAALLRKVQEISAGGSITPSVITFDIHPQNLLFGESVSLINSPEDRAGLIKRLFGFDDILFLHFDRETAGMTWDIFIDRIVDQFNASHLVAGYDFRFGSGGKGDSGLLEQKCAELGKGCDIIPEITHDGVVCSSTYIRELISAGDIERANTFLGHPHVLTDFVRDGYRLGRTLGAPTINMCFPEGVLAPAYGVYATRAFLTADNCADTHGALSGGHIGVTNIGVKPTVVDSGQITAETHILNYQGNLYGHQVRIEFHKRLRPEIKFDDIDKLKTQIQNDCGAAMQYFKKAL